MSAHVSDLLLDYVLGTLDAEAAEEVAAHLPGCGSCAAERAELMEALSLVAASVAPARPSAALSEAVALLPSDPLRAMARRVARLLDVGVERAGALLDLVHDAEGWEPGFVKGLALRHLPAGPSLSGAVVGYVRVAPDMDFPRHRHLGHETVLVLQGALQTEDGHVYQAGDLLPAEADTEHGFRSLPGEELLYLAIVDEGVDFRPGGGPIITARY